MTSFKFNAELYNKEAVLKAAYSYTDSAYVHIDFSEGYYIVSLEPKEDADIPYTEKEFQNEVLSQMVRQYVRKTTKDVRELLLARAFSSTVITDGLEETDEADVEQEEDIDRILTDWFETNGD